MDSEKHECLCCEWRKDPRRRDSIGQELNVVEHSLYSVRAADEKQQMGAVDVAMHLVGTERAEELVAGPCHSRQPGKLIDQRRSSWLLLSVEG